MWSQNSFDQLKLFCSIGYLSSNQIYLKRKHTGTNQVGHYINIREKGKGFWKPRSQWACRIQKGIPLREKNPCKISKLPNSMLADIPSAWGDGKINFTHFTKNVARKKIEMGMILSDATNLYMNSSDGRKGRGILGKFPPPPLPQLPSLNQNWSLRHFPLDFPLMCYFLWVPFLVSKIFAPESLLLSPLFCELWYRLWWTGLSLWGLSHLIRVYKRERIQLGWGRESAHKNQYFV